MYVHLMDPVSVVGHVDKDPRSIVASATPAMHADANDDFESTLLAHQRTTVVSLLAQNQEYGEL